jgi:thioredoxin-dependent peroxiredoxin
MRPLPSLAALSLALVTLGFGAACERTPAPSATSAAETSGGDPNATVTTPTKAGEPARLDEPRAPATGVQLGKPPPAMTARSHDGTTLDLATLRGKPVVIYFYPRDETPGCTKQACSFRDAWQELAKHEVVLIGISTDTEQSHQAFAKRHNLPFHLVSDPEGEIARAFDVPMKNGALARQTFVVGRDGDVVSIDREVDVQHAATEALAAVRD